MGIKKLKTKIAAEYYRSGTALRRGRQGTEITNRKEYRYEDTAKSAYRLLNGYTFGAKLLKGELLLLLNENLEAELEGKKLRYNNKTGLELISEGTR